MTSLYKLFVVLSLLVVCGCAAKSAQPLTYLALEKPEGKIQSVTHQDMKKDFSRGGWYFFNNNFRPAADLHAYIEQAQKESKSVVLRNADVQLNVPFALDILFFGFNHATDSVILGQPEGT